MLINVWLMMYMSGAYNARVRFSHYAGSCGPQAALGRTPAGWEYPWHRLVRAAGCPNSCVHGPGNL